MINRIIDFFSNHKLHIIFGSILVILDLVLTLIISYIFGALYNGARWDDFAQDNHSIVILSSIILNILFIVVGYLTYYKFKCSSSADVRRSKNNAYGSAQFLIDERNKHIKASQIKKLDQQYPNIGIGWILKAKYDKKQNHTNFNISRTDTFTHHIAVLGATRSGKTQIIILLTIVYNAKIQEIDKIKKPTFIITDIKGEICRNTYKTLIENGYEVLLFNLKDFAHSNTWNPLLNVTRNYVKAELKKKEANNYTGDQKTETIIQSEKLKDEAENLLHEIVNLIFQITAKSDNQVFDTLAQSDFYTAYFLA